MTEALDRSSYLSAAEISRLVGSAKDAAKPYNPERQASSEAPQEHAAIDLAGEDAADGGDAANIGAEPGPNAVQHEIRD